MKRLRFSLLYTKIRGLFVLLRIPENMSSAGRWEKDKEIEILLLRGKCAPLPKGEGKEERDCRRYHRPKLPSRNGVSLREVSGCARTRVQTILGF